MALERQVTLDTERIRIRALHTLEEMKLVVNLQEDIWGYGRPGAAFPYPDRCLFEFAESGGLVGGAFHGERIIGLSAAWLGMDKRARNRYLRSQLVGIREEFRDQGVGYHLKLQQRDYAREMDLDLIKWTFDPMKPRNANLNIRKLGGIVRIYTPDYYGNLQSTFNKGLATDRFWVEWYVNSSRVESRIDGLVPAADVPAYPTVTTLALAVGDYKRLVGYDLNLTDKKILIEMPANFESILDEDIGIAKEWQRGIREIFINYFGRGYVLNDLIVERKDGGRIFYVLSRSSLEEVLQAAAE